MSKYSYSLDVGEDLEKEMPLDEDVSVPKGLEKYEKEFKDLVDDKPEKAEAKTRQMKEEKAEKKEEKFDKKAEKPKEVRKEEKKVAAKEVKPVKEEKKEAKPRPVEKKIEKPALKVEKPEVETQERNSRYTIPVLIALIVLAALIYIIQGIQATDSPNGDFCTLSYINQQSGIALDWQHASEAQKYWLKKGLTSTVEAEAAEIFHMLGCKKADISQKADPASYADCKTPAVYVVVSDGVVQELKSDAKGGSVLVTLFNKDSKPRFFKLAYVTDSPKLLSWRVG